MKISVRAAIVAAGVLAAIPASAQQSQQATPGRPGSSIIMEVQEKLNQQGFNAGQTDGRWGPHTADAVRNYQQQKGLQATGELDRETLASLGISESMTGSPSGQPSSSSGGTSSSGQPQNTQPQQ